MGKNQAASGLTNIIQYDDSGNITFVSGSTTLMSVSSSGAITTTGTISGSNVQSASLALDSNLLQGTGSVGFTTTASFTATSGSASSRLTQIESVYATTGSNSFRATQSITGSLTVTGQIIAQTLNVQQVTSSIIYSSGSNVFGCDINSRQTFTGSFYQTGSVAVFAGNVGIGVVNPGLALDINGYAKLTGIGLNSTPSSIGANPNYVRLTNTGGDLYLGQEGSTNGAFFNGSLAYDSVLYSGRSINSIINGVSRMYVSSSGNVGIGTSTPAYTLDVSGTGRFTSTLLVTTSLTVSSTTNAGIIAATNSTAGYSYLDFINNGASGKNYQIGVGGNTAASGYANNLYFDLVGTGTIMTLTSGRNVGIRTSSTGFNAAGLPLVVGGGSGNTGLTIFSGATSAGSIHFADAETIGAESYAGFINYDHTANSMQFGTTGPTPTERMKITSGGTVFYKGYFGANLMGGFSVIGTLSAINVGDRYLHARINTIGSMMYWIKVFGYSYIYGIIEGLGGGYIGGGTGGVNQGFINGSIVAMYQNDGYLEIVVDTIGTGTTNRWGSITFLGGSDTITTVQPLEIMTYSWTSTTTRVY